MRRKSRHGEKRKNPEVRRGIKPMGENGTIWKAKIDMNKMFKENKLLRGAVPPPTTARPTEMVTEENKLLCRAVPPPTTATPAGAKKTEKELLRGTVPPPTTVTPAEQRFTRNYCGQLYHQLHQLHLQRGDSTRRGYCGEL